MKKQKSNSIGRLSSYDFDLPSELIAQKPESKRDAARLMIINKTTGEMAHRRFFDLPEILEKGDVLVFNDSKVIPARLIGKKETGGKMEVFLLTSLKHKNKKTLKQYSRVNIWRCLIKGKIKPGQKIYFTKKIFAAPIEKIDEKVWLVEFNASDKKLFSLGETPLPPYIKNKSRLSDYQTVYAKELGSVAAPTAGLHFTKALISKLKKKGVQIEYVTLHVGLGTFLPVETDDILKHKMHSELAEINPATAKKLNQAKKSGRRIIAVGTTAARTLESCAEKKGLIRAQKIDTEIFIYPGYKFKFVAGMITNFHLPKSTLLMLVSALAGKPLIDRAYKEAIKRKYRFYSFGDGMLII
ncbi:MAG: tRNA preQ1(34) S-adenosylmethionine ribosyltransferase-isomerase QueA [Candidatus Buchananbacteria bacterium]|jgi:S-adenosylmethionine:tRNA ribosyltransferase-isomerase